MGSPMTYVKVRLYALGLVLACLMANAGAAPAMRVALNIDQQPVRAALEQFSAQSGLQVLLRVDNISVDGVLAGKVEGEFTAQDALSQLLHNTGLTYEFVNDRTVRITVATAQPANSSSTAEARHGPPAVRQAQNQSPQARAEALQPGDVTITARRMLAERALRRVVIPEFVQSHSLASAWTDELIRWQSNICPETLGLQSPSNEFVSQRVLAIARQVGAPTAHAGRCRTNVEILFTADPAEQLSYVVRNEPVLLGDAPTGRDTLAAFDHPIKAWYATYTPHMESFPSGGSSQVNLATTTSLSAGWGSFGYAMGAATEALRMSGMASAHLGELSSEFVNVLILIDSTQVNRYPLEAIADYVAMLALTRTSLGGCSELPSVIDLLSRDCGARAKPQAITAADTAYLKALYAARLELKVTLARGEIRDRMLREIEGP